MANSILSFVKFTTFVMIVFKFAIEHDSNRDSNRAEKVSEFYINFCVKFLVLVKHAILTIFKKKVRT